MSVPFHVLKGPWHEFVDNSLDHCLFLNQADPLAEFLAESPGQRFLTFPTDPTTEAIAVALAFKARALTPAGVVVDYVQIEETPTNSVTWRYRTDFTGSVPMWAFDTRTRLHD